MEHIAIDVGARESQICVRAADGTVLQEERRATRRLRPFLEGRPASRVVLEACAEAFALADVAQAAGHVVVVVPATLAPALGVGSRGVKTDVRDARHLSAASCRLATLPAVHVPAAAARARKAECGLREVVVRTRTMLVNAARGWTRGQGLGPLARGTPECFPTRLRAHVAARGGTLPAAVERVLTLVTQVNAALADADRALRAQAQADPVCQRLMTMPGVGPVTAVRFAAALDDVTRFPSAAAVQGYLGLTPGEASSGERRRVTGITKAGPRAVRWALVQAAWSARRCRPHNPMVQWAARIERRRGRCIAIVALARKMAGILYAMWRDAHAYDPTRGAAPTGA